MRTPLRLYSCVAAKRKDSTAFTRTERLNFVAKVKNGFVPPRSCGQLRTSLIRSDQPFPLNAVTNEAECSESHAQQCESRSCVRHVRMLWMLGVFWVLGMVGHVTIPYRPNIPTVIY